MLIKNLRRCAINDAGAASRAAQDKVRIVIGGRASHSPPRLSGPTGFTLVELLVVIAIIGILVALLLPAIQSAREAARRSQCKNHLKQLALGCLLHEDTNKALPSGGWRSNYTADPNRGYGKKQPGSWYYNILAYIEEQSLRDLGKGMTGTALKDAVNTLHQMPVTIFHCPSRRPAVLYPYVWSATPPPLWQDQSTWLLPTDVPRVVKGDFAANSGDSLIHAGNGFTGTNEQMWPTPAPGSTYAQIDANPQWTPTDVPTTKYYQTGVIYYCSRVAHKKITDGSSNTYLVGEKSLSPDFYNDAPTTNLPGEIGRYGDNQGAYSGYEWDNHRVAWNPNSAEAATTYQPRQDRPGADAPSVYAFGSAHPASMNMAMCDGSVQSISYDIDFRVHEYLSSRLDGNIAKLEP